MLEILKNRKKVLLLLGVGLLGCLVLYAATHGRVVITNKGEDTLSITALEQSGVSLESKDIKNGAFVASGSYVVRNNESGQIRIAHIDVPRWFGAAKVKFDEIKTAKIERVAALTFENLAPADNGNLVSYTTTDGFISSYTTHQPGDAFGGKSDNSSLDTFLTSPVSLNDGRIAALTKENLGIYSFTTDKVIDIVPVESEVRENVVNMPKLQRSSDLNSNAFGVYQGMENKLTVVDDQNQIVTYDSIPKSSRAATFDLNRSGWVVARESRSAESSDTAEGEEERLPYEVTVYNAQTKDRKTIAIGLSDDVSHIALSPDAKYVAVTKSNYLWVYEVSSGQVVMVDPTSNVNQLFWNKAKLYALTTEFGFTVFDSEKKQLLPLSFNKDRNLAFSQAIPRGGSLYVTAYNTNEESKLPDGYVINLSEASDGVTEVLSSVLPIKNDDFNANYLGSTIYVRQSYYGRDEASNQSIKEKTRAAAMNRLERSIPENIFQQTTIEFVD